MTSGGIPKQGSRRQWGRNNATLGSFYQTLFLHFFRPRPNTLEIIKNEKMCFLGQANIAPGAIYSPPGVPVYSRVPSNHRYSPDVLDK